MMRLPGVGAGCQDAAGEPQHVRRGQGQHETRLTGRSLATSSSHSEATRGLRRRTAASGIDRPNGPPGRSLRVSGGVYAPLTAPHVLAPWPGQAHLGAPARARGPIPHRNWTPPREPGAFYRQGAGPAQKSRPVPHGGRPPLVARTQVRLQGLGAV